MILCYPHDLNTSLKIPPKTTAFPDVGVPKKLPSCTKEYNKLYKDAYFTNQHFKVHDKFRVVFFAFRWLLKCVWV